jgi:rod shape-determining protein MreC
MKRSHYILLAAVILCTIILLKLPPRVASQFKVAISTFFLPLFGLSTSTQQVAEAAGNTVMPKKELLKQNEQLRKENADLHVQMQRLSQFEQENERLRAMLAFQKVAPWKLRPAKVIARDPANWWRNVRIDLGRRDGMQPDLAVLTAEGLVGRISEVSENFARVVLLGDANCRVPATVWADVADARGAVRSIRVDHGVITSGSSVLDENIVELGYLSKASQVKSGQIVKTSSLSAIYPENIVIGYVIDTRPVDFGMVTVARVKLAVKMNLLDEVFVKLP